MKLVTTKLNDPLAPWALRELVKFATPKNPAPSELTEYLERLDKEAANAGPK